VTLRDTTRTVARSAAALDELAHAFRSPLRLRLTAELMDAPGGIALDRLTFLTGCPAEDVAACLDLLVRSEVVGTGPGGTYRFRADGPADAVEVATRAVDARREWVESERTTRRELLRGIVGVSPKMALVVTLVNQVARMSAPVLVTGETGTGKELIARAIHRASKRRAGPFVAINCGALSDDLFASEMFGHVRGAFTGAVRDHAGAFERADGGTLMLDEVADLSLLNQVKTLRVLQDGTYTRVGDGAVRHTNARIVAATNKPIADMVDRREFREDLLYRLDVMSIHIPPLRERREDIPYIVDDLIDLPRVRECWPDGERPTFTREALDALAEHDWPGNVRELEKVVMRSILTGYGPVDRDTVLDALHRNATTATRPVLADSSAMRPVLADSSTSTAPFVARPDPARAQLPLAHVEREHILLVVDAHRGNLSVSARVLGISRTTLYRRLRDFGLGHMVPEH